MKKYILNTIFSGIFSGTTLVVFIYFLQQYMYLSTELLMHTSLFNRGFMFCVCAGAFATFLWNTINCVYNMVKLLSEE
ncbi:hypothetical protein [Fibrobacter sp.]|uniref:hypothetical protein n=1 Tax=Fibrobacter sp. TaxID=35828 RepID=UPI0038673277